MQKFSVPEMSCGHCKAAVEGAIRSVDPDASVSVDLETRQIGVTTTKLSAADIASALKNAGYDSTPLAA